MTDFSRLGVAAIRDGVANGEFKAVEVAEALNTRVAAAKALNAFIVETPEMAVAAAQAVDADRAAGKSETYLDGSLVQSAALATKGSFDTDDLGFAINIGQDGTGKYTDNNAAEIDAVIDELAIWSRPLAGVEVAGLYAKALAGAGIVGAAPATLKLNGITAAGGNVTITWAGAAGVKLQSSATLGGVWADVTGSDGASTATIPAGNAAAFFRLVK